MKEILALCKAKTNDTCRLVIHTGPHIGIYFELTWRTGDKVMRDRFTIETDTRCVDVLTQVELRLCDYPRYDPPTDMRIEQKRRACREVRQNHLKEYLRTQPTDKQDLMKVGFSATDKWFTYLLIPFPNMSINALGYLWYQMYNITSSMQSPRDKELAITNIQANPTKVKIHTERWEDVTEEVTKVTDFRENLIAALRVDPNVYPTDYFDVFGLYAYVDVNPFYLLEKFKVHQIEYTLDTFLIEDNGKLTEITEGRYHLYAHWHKVCTVNESSKEINFNYMKMDFDNLQVIR